MEAHSFDYLDPNFQLFADRFELLRLKKMESETDQEEKGRGGATADIRIRKTQHMSASRYRWIER